MKKVLVIAVLLAVVLCGCGHDPEPTESTTAVQSQTAVETTVTDISVAPTQTEAPTDPIASLLGSMSLEEKVGQLFLARCPEDDALNHVEQYHLGGYILFGRDFQYDIPQSIHARIAEYQIASHIPMLIAVDEEGGDVTRISCFDAFRETPFPSPRKLFAQGGMELVLRTEQEKCELLTSLGINVNMAPVCDISTDSSAFMHSRSLGQDPQTTAQFASQVTELMSQNQIGSVLKHFPGYGNNKDTHTGAAIDDRSLEELETADLLPFSAGIEAGCGAILISHTVVNCLDSEHPASMSPAVHAYLRQQMGFSGVIVTDDLGMDAITKRYGDSEAAVLAVLAGNDLLCVSNYPEQYTAVLDAVISGRITMESIDAAVTRILNWKLSLGILVP